MIDNNRDGHITKAGAGAGARAGTRAGARAGTRTKARGYDQMLTCLGLDQARGMP